MTILEINQIVQEVTNRSAGRNKVVLLCRSMLVNCKLSRFFGRNGRNDGKCFHIVGNSFTKYIVGLPFFAEDPLQMIERLNKIWTIRVNSGWNIE